MALKIITDSASDLPKDIAKEYGVEIIPTPVVIDGKDYFDGETIMPDKFYDILKSGVDIKTYHINSFMFKEHFEKYAKNKDSLIYICFSTGIAGTFNAANLAKEELLEDYHDFDLTIIDSKAASVGFGLIVFKAIRMLADGYSKKEIIDSINFYIEHVKTIFTVETLEYLYKGGRLSKTSAIAGGLLDIKPLIKVNEEGKLVSFDKVRGRNKSIRSLVKLVGQMGVNLDKQYIGVVHGDDKDTLETVKQMLKDEYGCDKFVENYVGCAIGAHTGPGIIGITFLDKEPENGF